MGVKGKGDCCCVVESKLLVTPVGTNLNQGRITPRSHCLGRRVRHSELGLSWELSSLSCAKTCRDPHHLGVGEKKKCARHLWNFKKVLVTATLILQGNLKGTLPISIEFLYICW